MFCNKRTYLSFRHYGKTVFLLVTVPIKLNFLITFFASQSTPPPPPPLDTGSVLPQFQLKTRHTLTDILFDDVTILGIIMLFNPDITKPAEEVLFTNRSTSTYCPIAFDGIAIEPASDHKHLGLILDSKLTFNKHIDEKISIANRRGLESFVVCIIIYQGTQ